MFDNVNVYIYIFSWKYVLIFLLFLLHFYESATSVERQSKEMVKLNNFTDNYIP